MPWLGRALRVERETDLVHRHTVGQRGDLTQDLARLVTRLAVDDLREEEDGDGLDHRAERLA